MSEILVISPDLSILLCLHKLSQSEGIALYVLTYYCVNSFAQKNGKNARWSNGKDKKEVKLTFCI